MLKTTQDTDIDSVSTEKKFMQGSLYPKYCNGVIGVPITFLDQYNPSQFIIIGSSNSDGNPYLIEKNYTALGYKFLKADGKTISGSGALRDKRTPKINSNKTKDYSISPTGIYLEATYNRIFVQNKIER